MHFSRWVSLPASHYPFQLSHDIIPFVSRGVFPSPSRFQRTIFPVACRDSSRPCPSVRARIRAVSSTLPPVDPHARSPGAAVIVGYDSRDRAVSVASPTLFSLVDGGVAPVTPFDLCPPCSERPPRPPPPSPAEHPAVASPPSPTVSVRAPLGRPPRVETLGLPGRSGSRRWRSRCRPGCPATAAVPRPSLRERRAAPLVAAGRRGPVALRAGRWLTRLPRVGLGFRRGIEERAVLPRSRRRKDGSASRATRPAPRAHAGRRASRG